MKILIVAKESKYEWERKKLGLSHEGLIKKYSAEGANLEAILKGHERQTESLAKLVQLLPDADTIKMSELKDKIAGYDLVIAFGGDNSFQLISHYIREAPIMGINSDPERSTGALCAWSASRLEEVVSAIKNSAFTIENWTKLDATIDGVPLTQATSEYFFGEDRRKDMSRHVMVYRGKTFEQKSSGIIIATGAGSTGWYDSAGRYIFQKSNKVPKTEQRAVFVITEPYHPKADDVLAGELLPGEVLVIYSLNDAKGYATTDSWEEYDFSRGKKAAIQLSDTPLRVAVPRSAV